jgi:hypothetical protein
MAPPHVSGLVETLRKTGLVALAPAVVGDYFPNQTPTELAKKKHVCLRGFLFIGAGRFELPTSSPPD